MQPQFVTGLKNYRNKAHNGDMLMKNKLARVLSYILYIIAIILVVLFVAVIIIGYYRIRKLMQYPLVEFIPYPLFVKMFAVRLLVPAIVCVVSGYVLQRINIKNQ